MPNHVRYLMSSSLCRRRTCGHIMLGCLISSILISFIHLGAPESAARPIPIADWAPVTADDQSGETVILPLRRLVEPALPSHSWFSGDPSCAHLLTKFGRPGSLPDARLASFPRSGNTWARYLLEAATGLVTCGPTSDSEVAEQLPVGALPAVADVLASRSPTTTEELRAGGFIAEHVSPLIRSCIVGKTHEIPPAWRRLEGGEEDSDVGQHSSDFSDTSSSPSYPLPAVLLVRDPFRAIIALRHLETTARLLGAEGRANASAFSGPDWKEYVDRKSRHWFEIADEWADGPRHTLLMPYESLAADTSAHLQRMLHFLGVLSTPERLRCTLRHKEGRFHNRHHPVVPNEVFDASMRRRVWFRIRLLDDTLAGRGYQRLPLESYAFYRESLMML